MLHVASADATHQHYWSKATRQLGCSRRRLVVFAEICTWPKVVSTSVELLVTKAVVCRSLPGIGLASFICRQQFVRLHASCVATSSASSLSSSWHLALLWPRALGKVRVRCIHSSGDAKQQIFSECVKDQFCAKYGYERLLTTNSRRLSKHFPAFICVFSPVYVCRCVCARLFVNFT